MAQSVEEQAGALAERGESLADDTRGDPQAMAGNATDPSWQGTQANRTIVWTCDTASAVNEGVGERVRERLDCDERENAIAQNDPDEEEQQEQAEEDVNETQADADEAEQDAERAARDEAAAARDFVNDTREEPQEAPSHLFTFVNRTRAIVERLLGGIGAGASAVGDGVGAGADALGTGITASGGFAADRARDVGHGFAWAGGAVATGATTAVDGVAAGVSATGHGIAAAGGAIAEGASAMADGVANVATGMADALGSAVDAMRDLVGSNGPENGAEESGESLPEAGEAGDTADGVVDRVESVAP
jgi:hypothetical protein